MNVTDYTYLMNKPDAITEKQTEALGSVLNEFPYFQSARALRLKGLYSQNSFKYNYALKVTAAHTADRSVLFDFITSEKFTSIQNDFYDQKLRELMDMNVFGSEIVSYEQVKKTPEIRIDPIEQSILKSIKEATTVVFERPVKEEEKTIEPVIEEPAANTAQETEIFIEPIPTEEEILNSFVKVSEAEENTSEEIIEAPISIPTEEEILNSFVENTNTEEEAEETTAEEPVIVSPSEEEILDTFKKVEEAVSDSVLADKTEEEILETFTEVTEVEEQTFEPVIEESIASPSEDEILNTFTKVEENDSEPIEKPVSDSSKEEEIINISAETENTEKTTQPIVEKPAKPVRLTFFEEFVDDEDDEEISEKTEIPAAKIVNAITEPAEVVFEEAKEAEQNDAANTDSAEETTETAVSEVISKTEDTTQSEEVIQIENVSEIVKTAEENLEIGKPIDFSGNEKHSFQEWLQLARTEPIDRTADAHQETDKGEKKSGEVTGTDSTEDEKKKKAEIIDRFIEANPKISPIKPTMANPPIQFNINEEENSYLMTETLARVYLEQKKYTKAIQAYEILILKYPEKISFFADRISDIKILQQNNNNN
ncbi:tetratricopeptide repeat protein [Flavobacterium gelatinilyticum]|uniref:tetratricopeptide repeat protein n=1 Tax=Flavobacterium gelatinilyticum TaxID=3003260 RepID=UPI00247FF17B|nr:hypothetical protein [Flavobacterium gelatinilyticum]